eukprot:14655578-Alexandrium_andersonii.AAC.1
MGPPRGPPGGPPRSRPKGRRWVPSVAVDAPQGRWWGRRGAAGGRPGAAGVARLWRRCSARGKGAANIWQSGHMPGKGRAC